MQPQPYQVFPPENYHAAKLSPSSPASQKVMAYIRANFDRYELWSYQDLEKLMKDVYHPFLLKRTLSVLWANRKLEKWVMGEWGGAKYHKPGAIDVMGNMTTAKIGRYWGVHYKWI